MEDDNTMPEGETMPSTPSTDDDMGGDDHDTGMPATPADTEEGDEAAPM